MRQGVVAIGLGLGLVLAWPAVPAGAADAATAALLQAALAAVERGDETSALALLRRLAIADDPEGQYRLALLLEQPRSRVQPDPEGAAYWYERAAGQGHAGAARRLGDLYAGGTVGSYRSLGETAPRLGEAVRWYQLAATKGDPDAGNALDTLRTRFPLAEALLARASGDHGAARSRLEALAKRNDLEAMYWRGVMQEQGEGERPDPGGAVRWYETAYQLGFGPAALALGRLYEAGRGVPRDIDQAYRLYSAAQARGAAEVPSGIEAGAAIERLDFIRRFGSAPLPTVEDALQAIAAGMDLLADSLLRPLAEAGDTEAQHWLGTVVADRRWSHRDEAIRWYRAAALKGDAEAAYQLAYLLENSVDRAGRRLDDAAERVRWLRRAAEAGHRDATMALGLAYNDGKGVARDTAEAERWYKRAHKAEAGWSKLSRPACVEDETAPELLPAFLACNRGDADGLAAALLPLAQAGNARAQAWVGYLMAGGPGTGGSHDLRVRPNMQRAARWYRQAAEQGLVSAMYDYGVLLEHGMGVPADEASAKVWYAKAADRGYEPARKALAALR